MCNTRCTSGFSLTCKSRLSSVVKAAITCNYNEVFSYDVINNYKTETTIENTFLSYYCIWTPVIHLTAIILGD